MERQSKLDVCDGDPGKPRKFLVVVAAGGVTNAIPILEIARILHDRGHTIEFATLSSMQGLKRDYSFISKVHILGPSQSPEVEEEAYLQMSHWKLGLFHSFEPIMEARKYLESVWTTVYPTLSRLVEDPITRPHFIIADYLVDAVRDVRIEYDIPIAMHWPQMPTNMLPAGYIPGAAGLQIDVLTSEHATIWQRVHNYMLAIRALPCYLRYLSWVRRMRATLNIKRALPSLSKPDHLLLVNSFFGMEPAKDLPPNVAAIGPVLADSYPCLTPGIESFLDNHKRILYISLGTHVLYTDSVLQRILDGATRVLQSGTSVDGVIWSIRKMALKQFNLSTIAPNHPSLTVSDLVSGADPNILFTSFVPQRALLAHPAMSIFLTHAGPCSANEAVFQGIRTISIGAYFDQITTSMKLRDAGVSVPLDKDTFTASDLYHGIEVLFEDATGSFRANCERLRRIARVAVRRKYLAADLIEETLADVEGRRAVAALTGRKRAMHLEPADVRMPTWKARNWDLWTAGVGCIMLGAGIVVCIPIALIQ